MPGHRVATGAAVLLLFFQMSSNFFVAPAADALCLHDAASSAAISDHDHYKVASAHQEGDTNRNSFKHCKDTEAGVALTPAQPFAMAAAVVTHLPQVSWVMRTGSSLGIIQNILPSPFQPPRA